MENLMSNEEILEEIRKYSNPNYMWLEIWDISSDSFSQRHICHLGINCELVSS